MPLAGFDELMRRADERRPGLPVAAVGAADESVLRALRVAQDRGWVAPVLCGNAAEIVAAARQAGVDLAGMRIVDSGEPAPAAVVEITAGRAALLMKGLIATPDLIRAVLTPAAGLRTGRQLCQVVLMEVRGPRSAETRSFLLSDTGLTIQPTLDQKIDVLRSVVEIAQRLGAPRPRIGLMAATEKATEAMPETLDWAELERRQATGAWPDCVVQGPLSFDLAWAAEAGAKKHVSGAVLGAVDGMLFPNLLSANLTVKAIMYTADCRFGGVVRGAGCPIVFMSRADAAETRLHSLALALATLDSASPDPHVPDA